MMSVMYSIVCVMWRVRCVLMEVVAKLQSHSSFTPLCLHLSETPQHTHTHTQTTKAQHREEIQKVENVD